MESVMKLNSAQVEQALTQFEAQVIPDDHPLVPKLNELFGDHMFFLDSNGLNVRRFPHTWKSHLRDRTSWLGRQDSNLGMAELNPQFGLFQQWSF